MKQKLETKLCVAPDGPCALCGQRIAREMRKPEIYVAGSEDFVCYDCSAKTDQELANFIYRPEQYVGPSRDAVCPQCGCVDEQAYHVGSQLWRTCRRHGYRWRIGSGLLLPPTTPIEQQQADADFLSRLIEVKPLEVVRPPLKLELREPEFGSIIHQLELMRTLLKPGDETLDELTSDTLARVTATLKLYVDNFGLDALRARGVCVVPYQYLESELDK